MLDQSTGVITKIEDPLPHAGLGSFWGGIDCDRSTGVYVATDHNRHGGDYQDPYWSTDLITWTLCTIPTTQGQLGVTVRYDNQMQVWISYYIFDVYVSYDGKTFVEQGLYRPRVGDIQPFRYGYFTIDSETNPLGDYAIMMAPQTAVAVIDPTTWPPTALPMTTVALGEVHPVLDYLGTNNPFDSDVQYFMSGGHTYTTDPPALYVMSDTGAIIKSTSADLSVWTALAEKDTTGTPNAAENELIDTFVSGTRFQHFTAFNGEFYVQDIKDDIVYKYVGAAPGDDPVGYGWTDITLAAEGPFVSETGDYFQLRGDILDVPDAPWAAIGYDSVLTKWLVIYDVA